jgi:hypothetical protein
VPPAAAPVTAESLPGDVPIDETVERVADPPPDTFAASPYDVLFELLPPPVGLPPLPPALQTILRAAAPIVTRGCSGLGLATLVISAVLPTLDGIPLERLLPYLTPVTYACAVFPIPPTHTECAVDKPFIVDLGGLTTTPPIFGLGIDQLEQIEELTASMFGDVVPRLAPMLRDLLDCEVVKD